MQVKAKELGDRERLRMWARSQRRQKGMRAEAEVEELSWAKVQGKKRPMAIFKGLEKASTIHK